MLLDLNAKQTQCPECGDDEVDGLDDIHCQDCWERLCSESWWQMVNAIGQAQEGQSENPH